MGNHCQLKPCHKCNDKEQEDSIHEDDERIKNRTLCFQSVPFVSYHSFRPALEFISLQWSIMCLTPVPAKCPGASI